MSEITKEDRVTYWVLGFVISSVLIATGYVGRIATTPYVAPVVVTNTVTRTIQTPDYFEIGWRDGVFWGALAVARGATNLADAEARALAMRAEAVAAATAQKHQLQSNPSNILKP